MAKVLLVFIAGIIAIAAIDILDKKAKGCEVVNDRVACPVNLRCDANFKNCMIFN